MWKTTGVLHGVLLGTHSIISRPNGNCRASEPGGENGANCNLEQDTILSVPYSRMCGGHLERLEHVI